MLVLEGRHKGILMALHGCMGQHTALQGLHDVMARIIDGSAFIFLLRLKSKVPGRC